jgi:hypothetical protein
MSTTSRPTVDHAAIRASDAERQRVVEALRDQAAAGRLDVEELEDRVARAYAARTRGQLDPLLADLPTPPARRPAVAPAPPSGDLRAHLVAYVAVNLALIAVWALTGAGYFWPIWPLLGWGLGVVSHALPAGGCGGRRHVSPRPRA